MTTTQPGSCDLPLLVAGVPAAVRECLRAGGVPFAPLDGGDRARRRKEHQRPPRFVLYDSREAGTRRDLEALRHEQLVPIDLAPSLARAAGSPVGERPSSDSTFDTARPACPRLLQLLKGAVEDADGLWARVHEVPFPWNYDPPLWRPTPAELHSWRKIRSRIQLELARTSEAYRIVARGDFGGFRPAIEIWRGRHVASFELQPGETILPNGGLVYQQRSDLHLTSPFPRKDAPMKRVAGLVSALFLVVSAVGCCHHWGGCMPGCGPSACPPAYGGYGVTPGAVPVYPQTGAIYAPTETIQANYGGVPVAVQPVAFQTALVPLESLPTY